MTKLVLLTALEGAELDRFIRAFGPIDAVAVVADRAALEAAPIDDVTTLVSFGNGTIVPTRILDRLAKPAYNLHAGSPEFPGRDPHHWAIYDGAAQYGATMHVITNRVDEGPIVDVELFAVWTDAIPAELLAEANAACFRIIERTAPRIGRGETIAVLPDAKWSKRKRSRQDFREMCRLSIEISKHEFDRRYRAFDGEKYDNLTVSVHGRTFRIDKRSPR